VREPLQRRESIDDETLIEKVRALNGNVAAGDLRWRLDHYRNELKSPEQAEALKATYLARMGDVSAFIKELKGRFAQWYNKRHKRYGVLWADRFKSVLVENNPGALETMAAYIDLNSVRAGLVEDPGEYRYSGYGEMMGGGEKGKAARRGLLTVYGEETEAGSKAEGKLLRKLVSEYRKFLFVSGQRYVDEDGRVRPGVSEEQVRETLERGGEVGVKELVRLRVRHFHAGLVLGSREFVEGVFEANRERFGVNRKSGARPIRGLAAGDREGLMVLRDLRKAAFG
jgi:hypothetical protein